MLSGARAKAAAAQATADAARAVAGKLATLEARRGSVEEEIADWQLLADDYGRNGLQAAEVDAAGPGIAGDGD